MTFDRDGPEASAQLRALQLFGDGGFLEPDVVLSSGRFAAVF